MEKVIEKYNQYISEYTQTWTNRFTWRDSKNDPKHTTTIINFFNETNVLESIEYAYTLDGLFKLVDKLGKEYVKWVKDKSTTAGSVYSDTALEDMHRFFNGAIGEFFIVNMLTNVKCLYKCYVTTRETERYDFNYVAPTLNGTRDCGVDITCVANDVPSVIQVKWWNPYIKTDESKPSLTIFQKAGYDGFHQKLINMDDTHNVFLFWTGDESYTTRLLNDWGYEDTCCDFGNKSIGNAIDNRNRIFWVQFYKSLSDLVKI